LAYVLSFLSSLAQGMVRDICKTLASMLLEKYWDFVGTGNELCSSSLSLRIIYLSIQVSSSVLILGVMLIISDFCDSNFRECIMWFTLQCHRVHRRCSGCCLTCLWNHLNFKAFSFQVHLCLKWVSSLVPTNTCQKKILCQQNHSLSAWEAWDSWDL
jgi:hypothetical protein